MRYRALALAALVLLGSGSAAAQRVESYALSSGDRVTIHIYTAAGAKVDVVSGQHIVDREGNIFLPYVGSLHVAGLDETGLRELLVRRYSTFYSDPVVDVEVALHVTVTGAVGRPGEYFLDPTATIIDALANAGGMASQYAVASNQLASNPGAVRLVRQGKTIILDLRPQQVADSVLNMRVKSGDWIDVPVRGTSRVRDDVQFWGSILSFLTSIFALSYLVAHH